LKLETFQKHHQSISLKLSVLFLLGVGPNRLKKNLSRDKICSAMTEKAARGSKLKELHASRNTYLFIL